MDAWASVYNNKKDRKSTEEKVDLSSPEEDSYCLWYNLHFPCSTTSRLTFRWNVYNDNEIWYIYIPLL